MLIVDLIVIAVVVGAAVVGFRLGLNAGALAVIGFGIGAIVGSRLAPLMLKNGYEDTFAPAVALPAALLCGAIAAAAFERLGFGLRRHIRLRGKLNAVGGAVLAACLGLIAAWIVGAAAARIDDLRPDVRDSEIIERLNAVLPPPGPLLSPEKRLIYDPLPRVTGPRPRVGPVDVTIKSAPRVRAAASSIVKVYAYGCGRVGRGSGWIGRRGIVVTNAHVVHDKERLTVQSGGRGPRHEGEVIWFDRENDVALLRVSGVRGLRALPLGTDPTAGIPSAALSFPGGRRYKALPARTGVPGITPGLRVDGRPIRVPVTPFRSRGVKGGSSGGPIIDRSGRVRTMIFAGRYSRGLAYGVPTGPMQRALQRAGPAVSHGQCD